MRDVRSKIREYHPKLIVAGASAYSRIIDFEMFKRIIDEESTDNYRPYFMVDMAHIAGLVAAGLHPTPFGYADIITTTTHKTLRGPRGALIFCKPELAKDVDGAVFPGSQGGPLEHVIAAKAIAALERLEPSYRDYISNVINNCKAMCDEFIKLGYDIVSGGTDNHLFLIDLSRTHPHVSGLDAQEALDAIGISLNKNAIPNDARPPKYTSGLRIGTAAMTTKGYTAQQFVEVAHRIAAVLDILEEQKKEEQN